MDNVNGQRDNAFSSGTTATATLIVYPVKNVLAAFEHQYGQRRNNIDGWNCSDNRRQFTFRWSSRPICTSR